MRELVSSVSPRTAWWCSMTMTDFPGVDELVEQAEQSAPFRWRSPSYDRHSPRGPWVGYGSRDVLAGRRTATKVSASAGRTRPATAAMRPHIRPVHSESLPRTGRNTLPHVLSPTSTQAAATHMAPATSKAATSTKAALSGHVSRRDGSPPTLHNLVVPPRGGLPDTAGVVHWRVLRRPGRPTPASCGRMEPGADDYLTQALNMRLNRRCSPARSSSSFVSSCSPASLPGARTCSGPGEGRLGNRSAVEGARPRTGTLAVHPTDPAVLELAGRVFFEMGDLLALVRAGSSPRRKGRMWSWHYGH